MIAATTLLTIAQSPRAPRNTPEPESDKENVDPSPRQPRRPAQPRNQPRSPLSELPKPPPIRQHQQAETAFPKVSENPNDAWVRMGSLPGLFDVTPGDYYSRVPRPATDGLIKHLLTVCRTWEPNSDLAVSFTKMERLITTATWTSAEISNSKDVIDSATVRTAQEQLGPVQVEATSIFLSFTKLLTSYGTIPGKTVPSPYSSTPLRVDQFLLPVAITASQKGAIAQMRAHESNFLRVFRKWIRGLFLSATVRLSQVRDTSSPTPDLPSPKRSRVSDFDGNPSQRQRNGYWQAYQMERTGLDASPPTSTREPSEEPVPSSPPN